MFNDLHSIFKKALQCFDPQKVSILVIEYSHNMHSTIYSTQYPLLAA
jgi:hypothetical protein